MMFRPVAFAVALLTSSQAAAQSSIKILTPNNDSCAAFTTAMDTLDQQRLLTLSGWATGFLSGVAQGAGVDFLRNENVETVVLRILAECRRQPTKLLSLTLEEMSRSLILNRNR
jgi:hypothetical protein